MWRKPTPNITEVECHAALAPASTGAIRATVSDADTLPAFHTIQTGAPSNGGTLAITLLNAVLDHRAAPDAVVVTYLNSSRDN